MADVKSLTIHSTKYTIKDETARNNYSNLNSTVKQQATNITNLTYDVESNTQEIASLKSTVGGHTTSISQINSNIDTIESDIGGINSNIDTIESVIGGINSNIDTIESDIGGINSNIDTINSDIVGINNAIQNMHSYYQHIQPGSSTSTDIAHSPSWTNIITVSPNLKSGSYLFILNILTITLNEPSGNITFALSVDGGNPNQMFTIPITTDSKLINLPLITAFTVTEGQHNITPMVKIEQLSTTGQIPGNISYQVHIIKIS